MDNLLPISIHKWAPYLDNTVNSQGEKPSLYALIIDIDKLTQINKSFGYEVGNHLISETGYLLEKAQGVIDSGRIGDDTFYVIAFGRIESISEVSARLLANIAALPDMIESGRRHGRGSISLQGVRVSASIGIGRWREASSYSTILEWFRCGFSACEDVKKAGGNNFKFWPFLESRGSEWS